MILSELCQSCGKCCQCLVLPVKKPLQKAVMMDWLSVRGCEVVKEGVDVVYVKIDQPCPSLIGECLKSGITTYSCSIYKSRPEGCRIFDGRNYDFLDCAWKKMEKSMNYVILEKAKPYTRTRKGKFERIKGYVGKVKKPEIKGEEVFSIDSEVARTPQKVAELFAKTYWDRPREVEGEVKSDGIFSIVDGRATYRVRFESGKRFESVDTFKVDRLEKAFRMARSPKRGGEEVERERKERKASGEWTPRQERLRERAKRRKEEQEPPEQ